MSTLKSNSSKSGGGFNEIRFEDKKGEEQIFIHAQKNMDLRVKNDRFETIGSDRHLVVEKDKKEQVKNNRHEKVDADHTEEIGKDRHLKIVGKEAKEVGGSYSFGVTGDVMEDFKANHSENVSQTWAIKAMSVKIEGSTGIELTCGGSSIILTPAAIFIAGGPLVNINSGAGPPVAPPPAMLVSPTAPAKAEEADSTDPGEVAETKAKQRELKQGKYGSVQIKPYKNDPEKKSWIEIELLDEEGEPVPGERYRITLPDGSTVEGTLDQNGFARVDGIDPGNCEVSFPDLDQDSVENS
jgi:type VI secretion system secreted protein VgrG